MSIISLLAITCIAIEVWHIVYYTFLYEKYFKYPFNVTEWAQNYELFYKNFVDFSNGYVNNLDLQYQLGISKPLLEVAGIISDLGPVALCKKKILELCSMKQLILVVIQQVIEMLYWAILVSYIIIMPGLCGLIMFIGLNILSKIQKTFNKNKTYIYMNIDSMACIVLYVFIIYWFR